MKKQDVYEKLKEVIDPELGVNIVDLGLVYKISVKRRAKSEKYGIKILMTLTSPGCPLSGVIDMMVREAVGELPGVDGEKIELEITFDPPWTPEMMSDEVKAELGMD